MLVILARVDRFSKLCWRYMAPRCGAEPTSWRLLGVLEGKLNPKRPGRPKKRPRSPRTPSGRSTFARDPRDMKSAPPHPSKVYFCHLQYMLPHVAQHSFTASSNRPYFPLLYILTFSTGSSIENTSKAETNHFPLVHLTISGPSRVKSRTNVFPQDELLHFPYV